ncbi:MAG: CDGSH iron-sulfur domain-containing protein [Acidobacteria bacterium]|nr:MAG: CDGSH iron-sulfur domain-containing protein [Acidobacteriota bacterium]
MARKVIHHATRPLKVGDKWICRCGLSKNWQGADPEPWCDGSHKLTDGEEPGKIYEYDENGERVVVG